MIQEQDDDTEPNETRESPFNPWRMPKTDKMKGVIEEVIRLLKSHEEQHGLRQRKRRQADQEVFEATVSAVLCDLIYRHIAGDEGGVFITRSNQILAKRSRYRPPAFGKALPDILDRMETPELGFLVQSMGYQNEFGESKRTTIKAASRTQNLILRHDITFEDLSVSPAQEVIILRSGKDDYWDKKEDQEYVDTPDTIQLSKKMQEINAWLENADINFDESAIGKAGLSIDTGNRLLRRIFTQNRFDSGGRLFGGFWQRLPKAHRKGIVIDGEEAAELDYGQMAPRIVYGLCKATPPRPDIYNIPRFTEYRDGVKQMMNAMLFNVGPLKRMPRGIRQNLPRLCTVHELVSAIEDTHVGIKDRFFVGIGHEVQNIESNIMVDVLLDLKANNIIALPIHDAVLAPISKRHKVKEIMLSTFLRFTGIEGIVSDSMERGT